MRKPPTNDVEFMREQARIALWEINYHDTGLVNAHKSLEITRQMLDRTDIVTSDEEARELYEKTDDQYPDLKNGEQFAIYCLGKALHGILWHEEALRQAQAQLACVKAALKRGKYIEISLDEVAKELRKGRGEEK